MPIIWWLLFYQTRIHGVQGEGGHTTIIKNYNKEISKIFVFLAIPDKQGCFHGHRLKLWRHYFQGTGRNVVLHHGFKADFRSNPNWVLLDHPLGCSHHFHQHPHHPHVPELLPLLLQSLVAPWPEPELGGDRWTTIVLWLRSPATSTQYQGASKLSHSHSLWFVGGH